MALHMNFFRVLADLAHTLSKCILIWAIHVNKSAEGVSLITQALYALVFCTRYWDLFSAHPESPHFSLWNFVLKIFYLVTSFYIIFIMMKLYPRTREQERSWRLGVYCLAFAVIGGPSVAAMARGKHTSFFAVSWTFSIILESVCVIPQLLLLRQTTVPTVIDSGYILALGSYRALYILNWIVRLATRKESNPDWRAVVFGVIQTALYVDFAWVYWTRQRVKLRNGGVVDTEDFGRGFLVGKILGRGDAGADEESSGPRNNGFGVGNIRKGFGRWGKRGVSVTADDDVEVPGETSHSPKSNGKARGQSSRAADDSMAHIQDGGGEDEEEDDEDDVGTSQPATQQSQALMKDHERWSDNDER